MHEPSLTAVAMAKASSVIYILWPEERLDQSVWDDGKGIALELSCWERVGGAGGDAWPGRCTVQDGWGQGWSVPGALRKASAPCFCVWFSPS